MRNDINIFAAGVQDLPGSATIISPTFEINNYISIFVDSVIQRVGGLDTSVFIRVQQSDDGVLWHDPLFVGVVGTTAAIPRPRNQTAGTPSRKFARITFVNQTVNPTNLDYTLTGKTNA